MGDLFGDSPTETLFSFFGGYMDIFSTWHIEESTAAKLEFSHCAVGPCTAGCKKKTETIRRSRGLHKTQSHEQSYTEPASRNLRMLPGTHQLRVVAKSLQNRLQVLHTAQADIL